MSGEEITSFYDDGSLERVLINGGVIDDFYEESKIVSAVKKGNVIVVCFKLSEGRQNVYPVTTKKFSVAPSVISENDLLVRSFVKSNGKWELYLNFYPQTIFGDTVDESVKRIEVHSVNKYSICYSKDWYIVGRKLGEDMGALDTRVKSYKEKGEMIKMIKFSPVDNVLFALDENIKYYSRNFIWWGSFVGFDNNEDFEIHMKNYFEASGKMKLKVKNYDNFAVGDAETVENLKKFYGEFDNGSGE